ncbi:MAG: flagellar biosynthesis protein FlhF [Selenomonadaceae bacterium]|nr:flagellar biosynthesis protein FlhF [Selenomonadaceae bacterium]
MRIKVFKAPTMKDAMANVKAELGDDAVILHTKRYRKGGLMGFRSKEIIEIIAAVEDQSPEERVNIAISGRGSEGRLDISSPAGGIEDYQQEEFISPEPVTQPGQPMPKVSKRSAVKEPENVQVSDSIQVPAPIKPPRGILAQYQTAGTAKQVQKAQAKIEEEETQKASAQVSATIADLMEVIKRQGNTEKTQQPAEQKEMETSVIDNSRDMYDYPLPEEEDYPPPLDDDYYGGEMDIPRPVEQVKSEPVHEEKATVSEEMVFEPKAVMPAEKAEKPQEEITVEKEASKKTVAKKKKKNIKNTKNNAEIEDTPKEPVKQEKKSAPEDDSENDSRENEILQLQEELAQMKAMLSHAMSGELNDEKVVNLQIALKQNEVNDKVIQDMISRLTGAEIVADKNSAKARAALEKYLRKTIRVATGITLFSGRPKVVALIGATGVGKTTTLAKIAAKFVLEKGVSAAMITADTYRISAVDQLKTYSDIIGLPLEIVYSPDALKKAIDKHSNKQLILIDTAGRSQYNDYQMKELCEFLAVDKNIEKHLVMSATTKNRDAEAILEHFSVCKPDRVIFTKTDETSSIGLVPNLLHKKKIALSYLTDGQSVPDDIHPASIEKLAELLLR